MGVSKESISKFLCISLELRIFLIFVSCMTMWFHRWNASSKNRIYSYLTEMPESIAEHKHNPHEKTQHTASVSLLTAWVLIIAAFLKWLISWRYFNYEDSEMAGLNLGNHFVLDFLQGLSAWTTALLTGMLYILLTEWLGYFWIFACAVISRTSRLRI